MQENGSFDFAIVGGGVMGCTTALHLARAGSRVALIERGGLCMEASGRNAGTLTMMFTRAPLVPYAQRGRELWRNAGDWLGRDVGFRATPGLGLCFRDEDVPRLEHEMMERRDAGAPIEIIGANRAREIEPAVSERVVMAAYCPEDGYAYSYKIGVAYHAALVAAGVAVREGRAVEGIDREGGGFVVRAGETRVRARMLVLAGGTWLGKMARWLGVELPVVTRVNQGTISERLPMVLNSVIEVFGRCSIKQAVNGTVLVGTVLQWINDPDRAEHETDPLRMMSNLLNVARTAAAAIPPLAKGRIVRTWTGLEGYVPDNMPVIGPLPGVDGAYVIGCMRSGFTAGPFMGRLMADQLLGRVPEMPIFAPAFDPARLVGVKGGEAALARLAFA